MGDFQTASWTSISLSKDMSVMRDSGEGQHLEFKSEYPQNGRDLAKEIAAFATTHGGTILIGVGDDGELIGLSEGETSEGRDNLMKRVAGICKSNVNPAILPSVEWGVEDDKVVMAIVVPKGSEPVYYSTNIPYLRHLTTSRPAEPHEVVQLILAHYKTVDNEGISDASRGLIQALVRVLVFGHEADRRMVNPWVDMWRTQFKEAASEIRDLLAAEEISPAHDDQLRLFAKSCDDVANLRITMGCGPDLTNLVTVATEQADALWRFYVEPIQSRLGGKKEAKSVISKAINQLVELSERAEGMLYGGASDEFIESVSAVGGDLVKAEIIYLRINLPAVAAKLQRIGQELHLFETVTIYLDGGQSQERLMADVTKLTDELKFLAKAEFP